MLRGARYVQLPVPGIPSAWDLSKFSDGFGEDGNPQQQTRVAELYASKGSELPGAAIDARCARITLWGIGLAAGMTEGIQITRSALNRRNPSITEEAERVAEGHEIIMDF